MRNDPSAEAAEHHLNKMRRSYRRIFGDGVGKTVLADLSVFCWAMHSTWASGDPYESARRDGQRSVILRIYEMLNLTPHDVAELVYGPAPEPRNLLGDDDE